MQGSIGWRVELPPSANIIAAYITGFIAGFWVRQICVMAFCSFYCIALS